MSFVFYFSPILPRSKVYSLVFWRPVTGQKTRFFQWERNNSWFSTKSGSSLKFHLGFTAKFFRVYKETHIYFSPELFWGLTSYFHIPLVEVENCSSDSKRFILYIDFFGVIMYIFLWYSRKINKPWTLFPFFIYRWSDPNRDCHIISHSGCLSHRAEVMS